MANVIKSKNDDRDYKLFMLENELKCLVVSDPKNDKAAAAMTVCVGSYNAPSDIPGLAHFLEHMLFFGSKAYPEENYYNEYITQHGGYNNAETSHEETTYYFDICSTYFEHALDIFSHFFIDPIFNEEMIEREINAIDSEFFRSYNDNCSKQYQILYNLMDDDYPITKFSCGNKKTLLVPCLHQRMLEFYYNNYSAGKMNLVVISKLPIWELEKLVRDKFSSIRTSQIKTANYCNKLPYDKLLIDNDGIPFIKIESDNPNHELSLYWQLPSVTQKYKFKLDNFWSNILGHEGENSLFSYLRDQSLVTSLCVGNFIDENNFSLFEITMNLTEKGNSEISYIINVIRIFMDILLKMSDNHIKRIYEEDKEISFIDFNNISKVSTISYALKLVSDLTSFDDEHILFGQYYYQDFNNEVLSELKEYFKRLHSIKPLIIHNSEVYKNMLTQEEEYYNGKYDLVFKKYDFVNDKSIRDKLSIPSPNNYIPEDLSLMEGNTKIEKIKSSTNGELWYALDTSFNLPKIKASFNIILPYSMQTCENSLLNILYIKLLNDTINEKLYSAILTDNQYSIQCSKFGFIITIYGYTDKITNVLSSIFDTVGELTYNQERFTILVDKIKEQFKRQETWNTQQQIHHHLDHLHIHNPIHYKYALNFLESISEIDLVEYEKKLFNSYYYIALVQGNCSLDKCNQLYKSLCNFLDYKNKNNSFSFEKLPVYLSDFLSCNVVDQYTYNYEPFNKKEINTNSSTLTYYYFGDNHFRDYRNQILVNIFQMMISDSFFDKLRTKQQLGYSVQSDGYCINSFNNNKGGFFFTIQSSKYDCQYLQEQINKYIENIREQLNENSFSNITQAVITNLSQPFKSLDESFEYNSDEIFGRSFDFDSKQKRIEITKELKFSDLIQYVEDNIINNSKKIIINVN